MEEIWKPVNGFEDKYQVSNLGNVKSLNFNGTKKERILKPSPDGNGYYQVALYKDGKRHIKQLNRLVAEHFISEIPEGYEVNHKDEDIYNNNVNNLEIITKLENIRYGTGIKRRSKTRSKPVLAISLNKNQFLVFQSIKQASEELNVSNQSISGCLKRKCKTIRGYTWEYIK